MRRKKAIIVGIVSAALLAGGAAFGLDALDKAYPPPLEAAQQRSFEVLDRDGRLLRAFATPDGRWRLKTSAAEVDPQFLRMLIAYEDQRFYDHHGIDPWALLRSAWQLASNGRIVSGASTLSMQVARLIEPRTDRSFSAKFLQGLRALQIERRLDKVEILDLYLNIAPYGGNLEGVRAASLAWFGKEPARLDTAEAALLVALPQLPEKRRPDRFPDAARQARERVLQRLAVERVVGEGEAERATLAAVPANRRDLPAYAPHMAAAARVKFANATEAHSTLRLPIQRELEAVARHAAEKLTEKVSVAIVMADAQTGDIVAEVGSADYLDTARRGFVEMSRAVRSPGSTLKPFIYGLAFENGLIGQETIIEDRPADFSGYRPRNFDMHYQGDVSIRQALQLSLNVPAVKLLDAVSPSALMVRFRRVGVKLVLPTTEAPGLAIALGGAGISLVDLVQLYAGLAGGGDPVRLGDGVRSAPQRLAGDRLFADAAIWNVSDILSGVLPPLGMKQRGIAYKTGTSYGYRDAWSVGYDGRHVIGVWVGRADNGAVPGIAGYATAAPILFEAFEKSGVAITPMPAAPSGVARVAVSDLPANQRRFTLTASGLLSASRRESAPRIVYPPEGARVELSNQSGISPLVLKLQGGRAPFRWLANGRPLPDASLRRNSEWRPEGQGFSTLTVIDADGRASSVRVFIE
ncbi:MULTISPECIES: penicillin-binding protein 1C [Rhizobium/Agrobacterium group]|uniref:penicillin-binding protein 1C n=1 Tax=Rhizobium/Agrobacterium group TaxID=227290 RepID=UPI0003F1CA9D|nr:MULTISPECIES: penicillin-binding protein 1C [Rhizobium/Agrobacterium group]AHK03491.1 multimodular transpeptidase-transglycosylase [Agrobacterium tumefaciens LBA4213 (Ach5)]AKC09258.1 penicillin binding protein [Agrobacterium tumefaciens]AYM18401.1 penicillin binding protein [Agrobacterium tumefaciens]AYM69700.1 penicillin binding protein [Agrobacterium tumefaciens]NIB56195.1 penicillin-binding protein 1C [Agrobacterium tumefaciens]